MKRVNETEEPNVSVRPKKRVFVFARVPSRTVWSAPSLFMFACLCTIIYVLCYGDFLLVSLRRGQHILLYFEII